LHCGESPQHSFEWPGLCIKCPLIAGKKEAVVDLALLIGVVVIVLVGAVVYSVMTAAQAADRKRSTLLTMSPPPPGYKRLPDRPADRKVAHMQETPFPERVSETKAKAMLGRYAIQKIVDMDPKGAAQVVSRWNDQGKAEKE